MQRYHVWEKNQERASATEEQNSAAAAVNAFYHDNGRYPCPADPTLNVTDPAFGEEDINAATGDCLGGTANTQNFDISGTGAGPFVITGAVPFKALNLTMKETLDPWNQKYNYVVTDILTTVGTFAAGSGQITINQINSLEFLAGNNFETCANPAAVPPPPPPPSNTGIHYTLYSNGQDGAGAFTAEGAQPIACPAAGATLDAENCDNDNVFTFHTCASNDTIGANRYDDWFESNAMVAEKSNVPVKTFDTGTDPNDVGTTVGYIGIGNNDPQAELDVIGNIRAERDPTDPTESGQAHASEFCDQNGSNCFDAKSIAGNDPRMRCGSDKGMSGIGSSKAKCSKALTRKAFNCPKVNGQQTYIIQIPSTGEPICGPPPAP